MEASEATFHCLWNQYDGIKSEGLKRLKELEGENRKLKEIVAEQALVTVVAAIGYSDLSARILCHIGSMLVSTGGAVC